MEHAAQTRRTYAQLKELEGTIHLGKTAGDSSKYIQLQAIDCSNGQSSLDHTTMDSFTNAMQNTGAGRWTLRGPNGAGKSTLLAVLKEKMGNAAYLLPSNYLDLSFKTDFIGHSDGNRLLAVFSEIATLDEARYVLLDEWDANLDGAKLATACKGGVRI